MSFISTILNFLGLILLAHSAYSSYEHSLLASTASLPTDIIAEAIISSVFLVFGIVLASPALRPIEWASWAGETEKDTRRSKGHKRFENDGGAEGISMSYLEDRKGFYDIRTQRKEFAEWLKKGGSTSSK